MNTKFLTILPKKILLITGYSEQDKPKQFLKSSKEIEANDTTERSQH